MNNQGSLILGIVLGAGLMYVFDPERGRRRRALIRDQFVHGAHEIEDLGDGMASTARHIRNRARGVVFETRNRFNEDEVDDSVLAARVRSHLGRLVSDPSRVEVTAEHGRVTLRGEAPDREMRRIVDGVEEVPGVHDVINRLKKQETLG